MGTILFPLLLPDFVPPVLPLVIPLIIETPETFEFVEPTEATDEALDNLLLLLSSLCLSLSEQDETGVVWLVPLS
jgi:hypothetical protein